MAHQYGVVKCKLQGGTTLRNSRKRHETQYHLHVTLLVGGDAWDTAINVGTDDADDLLNYKIAFDFHHDLVNQLDALEEGFHDLTGTSALPALDFLRSDVLSGTGPWRESDVMDGSATQEPVATLKRLLERAKTEALPVFVFGRTYTSGGSGIHDIHMNQGSDRPFINNGTDANDHNDVWQDGAVLVKLPTGQWAAYFTAFTKQTVPTDDLGNPSPGGHSIDVADEGSQR